jgi:uncharacterized protein (TIGR03382 family)
LNPVPESSAMALAGLDGLSLLLFRRRKQLIESRRTNELTARGGARKFSSAWVTK